MTTPRADQPGASIHPHLGQRPSPRTLKWRRRLEVVRTPDPDPFADRGHQAIGHLHKDDKHKVECEVCHRYLKSFDLRVEHVKNFHPTVLYDCVFYPGVVFYTIRDLLNHCHELHFV